MRDFKKEELENEYWKPLVGYEGYCEGSSLGRIKKLSFEYIDKKGYQRKSKEIIFKLGYYSNGYEQFSTYLNGKRYTAIAHRLIAKTFIPNPKNKPQVNHKNGVRDDNRIENLEWCTISENIKHSFNELGRSVKNNEGENNPKAILTKEDVLEIRRLHKEEGLSNYKLAEMYNMKPPAIWKILHKYTWKHII